MDPFLGEIRMFGFPYAPKGWALCQGQTLSITQSTALFSLLGTLFGGDGRTNLGLPNLQARVAVGSGQGPGTSSYVQGQTGGATGVTLTLDQLGAHGHALNGSTDVGTSLTANGNVLAQARIGRLGQTSTLGHIYSSNAPTTALSASSLNAAGGNGSHNNMQPYVTMNYCIALVGIYPMRP